MKKSSVAEFDITNMSVLAEWWMELGRLQSSLEASKRNSSTVFSATHPQ